MSLAGALSLRVTRWEKADEERLPERMVERTGGRYTLYSIERDQYMQRMWIEQ